MALMDAGVDLSAPAAGVAMGLVSRPVSGLAPNHFCRLPKKSLTFRYGKSMTPLGQYCSNLFFLVT